MEFFPGGKEDKSNKKTQVFFDPKSDRIVGTFQYSAETLFIDMKYSASDQTEPIVLGKFPKHGIALTICPTRLTGWIVKNIAAHIQFETITSN